MTKSKKKTNFKSKLVHFILFIIVSAGIGFLIGYLSGGILEDFFDQYINKDKLYVYYINMFLMLFVFLVGHFFHIIIHEGGHLVFGLISGYEFISFRVDSLMIIKEDDHLKFKRYNIPGTGGQCLLMPPEKVDGDFPFILYNLGGALFNIIFSLITIGIAALLKEFVFIHGILIIISGAGIFTALTNAIPLKIGGISNDGHNIMTMMLDNDSKESFYLQLKTHGLLSKGIRMKDMSGDQFYLKEDIDYNNPLNFSRIFMNYDYHLDQLDFKGARAALDFGKKHVHKTIDLYKNELDSELLFLELIDDCDPTKIEKLYNKKLEKYIKASKFSIDKKRIMMAYEAFYTKNDKKAIKYFQELIKLTNTYPVKGETYTELMLGDFIKERVYDNQDNN